MTDIPVPTVPEVRTHRLVITDRDDAPRIVGDVIDGTAELRVGLNPLGPSSVHVLLYAATDDDLGPQVGVQLWAHGDAHAEINLMQLHGDWTAKVHLPPNNWSTPVGREQGS